MIDLKKFALLQKKTSQSFQQQKLLIKQVIAGNEVLCKKCGTRLRLNAPTDKNNDVTAGIVCSKGCTEILLDFDN